MLMMGVSRLSSAGTSFFFCGWKNWHWRLLGEERIICSFKGVVWTSLAHVSVGGGGGAAGKAGSCTQQVPKLGTWQPVPALALYCSFHAGRGEKAEVLELQGCRARRSWSISPPVVPALFCY